MITEEQVEITKNQIGEYLFSLLTDSQIKYITKWIQVKDNPQQREAIKIEINVVRGQKG